MNIEKGVAYCGLACCVCSENDQCAGCRNEGCKDKEWCKSFNCCKKKKINGCWECPDFPCENEMFHKLRIRAFADFIKRYGEKRLLECLKRNEESGIVYHYQGQLTGDYDIPESEDEIIQMLLNGRFNFTV